MSSVDDGHPSVAALAADLLDIQDRHYSRAFGAIDSQRHRMPDLSLPAIGPLVRGLHEGCLDADSLRVTLELAIGALDAKPLRGYRGSRQELARLLFLTEYDEIIAQTNELSRYNPKLSTRLKALIQPKLGYGIKDGSRTELLSELRDDLAKQLIRLSRGELDSSGTGVIDQVTGLVNRPELERWVTEALADRNGPVVLWGESGNGKSTLVRKLARRYPPDKVVYLQGPVSAESRFNSDLLVALTKAGVSAEAWDLAARLHAFVDLCHTGANYELVVIDDLADESVQLFLGKTFQASILITRREQPPKSATPSKWVGAYEPDEALAAAKAYLPDLSDAKLRTLCERLGLRPIGIDLACRLVQSEEFEFETLLEMLRREPSEVIDAAESILGDGVVRSPLRAVYEAIAEILHKHRYVSVILDILVWVTGSASYSYVLLGHAGLLLNLQHDDLRLVAALDEIARRGLIDRSGDGVQINDLSLDYLRSITSARAKPIHEQTYRKSLRIMLDRQKPGDYPSYLPSWGMSSSTGYALSFQIRNWRSRTKLLAAGKDFGSLKLMTGNVLLWQDGWSLFTDAPGLQFALVDKRRAYVYSESIGKQAIEDLPEVAAAVVLIVDRFDHFVMYAEAKGLMQLLLPSVRRPAPLEMYPTSPLRSQHIAIASLSGAEIEPPGLDQQVWTWCGELSTEAVLRGSTDLPNCDRCVEVREDPELASSRRRELEAYRVIVEAVGKDSIDPSVVMLIDNSLRSLSSSEPL